jgi:nitrogen fixation/metabolism regulation signal transduction histidine kinase
MRKQSVASRNKSRSDSRYSYIPYTALTLDTNYCVCTYGDAASGLFGYPETLMLGKHISKILPDLGAKVEEKDSTRTSAPLRFNEVRMEAKHANGNVFPVMVGLRQDYQQGTCRHLVLVRNLENKLQA